MGVETLLGEGCWWGRGSSKTRILLDLFPKDVKDFSTWCLLSTTHDGRKKMFDMIWGEE